MNINYNKSVLNLSRIKQISFSQIQENIFTNNLKQSSITCSIDYRILLEWFNSVYFSAFLFNIWIMNSNHEVEAYPCHIMKFPFLLSVLQKLFVMISFPNNWIICCALQGGSILSKIWLHVIKGNSKRIFQVREATTSARCCPCATWSGHDPLEGTLLGKLLQCPIFLCKFMWPWGGHRINQKITLNFLDHIGSVRAHDRARVTGQQNGSV